MPPDFDDVIDYRLKNVEEITRAFGPTVGEVAVLHSRLEGLARSIEKVEEREKARDQRIEDNHKEVMAAIEASKFNFWKALGYSTPIIVALITTLLAQ